MNQKDNDKIEKLVTEGFQVLNNIKEELDTISGILETVRNDHIKTQTAN